MQRASQVLLTHTVLLGVWPQQSKEPQPYMFSASGPCKDTSSTNVEAFLLLLHCVCRPSLRFTINTLCCLPFYLLGAPCSCTEPGSVDQSDLADTPPLQFIAGVAGDLQIPDERAVGMATNWVAGHCRSRIVEVRVVQCC